MTAIKEVPVLIVTSYDTYVRLGVRSDFHVAEGEDAAQVIMAAINALGPQGGTVFLAPGTYNCQTAISASDLGRDNVSIVGSGRATRLNRNGTSPVIVVGSRSGWAILDLETDAGGVDLTGSTASYARYWRNGTRVVVGDSHSHTSTDGTGQIDHANLLNVLPDQHHPQNHASRHAPGGADDISGSYVKKAGDTMTGSLGIQGTTNVLELGAGVIGKEANAGKIGYQRFSADALDIIGAGPDAASRKIRFWAEGGTILNGLLRAPSLLAQPSTDAANVLRVLTAGGSAVLRTDTSPLRNYVMGRLVLGAGTVTLANGDNNDVDIGDVVTAFISGPTAAFAITGLANPEAGRIAILYNTTGQTMTLKNDNAGSAAANRILTPAGTDLSAKAALLIYHGLVSRWRVVLYI